MYEVLHTFGFTKLNRKISTLSKTKCLNFTALENNALGKTVTGHSMVTNVTFTAN